MKARSCALGIEEMRTSGYALRTVARTAVLPALKLGLVVVALVACEPEVAPTPYIAPTPEVTPVLHEDFSPPTGKWETILDAMSEVGVEDEAYSIFIKDKAWLSWGTPGLSVADVVVEVYAEQVKGPNDNLYGVLLRYQNPDNFYLFQISGDGYWAVMKRMDGDFNYLKPWTFSEDICQGACTNHLKVSARGPIFGFHVNGQRLGTVEDHSFSVGDIGLSAGSFDQPGLEVFFDDLWVYQAQ